MSLMLLTLLSACAPTVSQRQRQRPPRRISAPVRPQAKRPATATWYGPGFHGRRTASGERFDQHALTAAHPTLPLGSQVEVTNVANGKTVQVRINDRGPRKRGRSIDLSRGAAQELGMLRSGVSRVRIKRISARRTGTRMRRTRNGATRERVQAGPKSQAGKVF